MAYIKNVNQVRILGRIAKDPQVYDIKGGARCVTLTIVTEESYRDEKGEWQSIPTWHIVKAWNDKDVDCLRKGHVVQVEGKIKVDTWTDKKTNEKKSQVYILSSTVVRIATDTPSAGVAGDMPDYDSPM